MPQTVCRVSRQEMLILKRPEGHKHCVSCPRQRVYSETESKCPKVVFLCLFFLKNMYMKMTCQFMLNSSHFIFRIAQEEKMRLKPFILMLLK